MDIKFPLHQGGQDLFIPSEYSVDTVQFIEKDHPFPRAILHQLCHKSSVDICMVYFCALFHSIVMVDIFSNSEFNFIMILHIQWLNFPILIIFTMVLFPIYLLHIYANFRISLWISTFKKLQCVLVEHGIEGNIELWDQLIESLNPWPKCRPLF